MWSEYAILLKRYLRRRVCISTHGYNKIWGKVGVVNDECVVLLNTLVADEHDNQGWFAEMHQSDDDFGPRNPETIVHFHHIVAITCVDEDIVDVPLNADEQSGLAGGTGGAGMAGGDSLADYHSNYPTDEDLENSLTTLAEMTPDAADQLATVVFTSGSGHTGGDDELYTHDEMASALKVDRLGIDIGYGLIRMADADCGGDLLSRIRHVRYQMASSLGLVVPKVRVRDDALLDSNSYRITLDGCEIDQGTVLPDRFLAMANGGHGDMLPGEETRDPVFQTRAYWVDAENRKLAEERNYSLIDPSAVIATHLQEVIRRFAGKLFSLDQLQQSLERLRTTAPALVDEIVPRRISMSAFHRVLCRLLDERVSIKDLERILESVAHALAGFPDAGPDELTTAVRVALGRKLCEPFRDELGQVLLITLAPRLQETLVERLQHQSTLESRATIARFVQALRPRWRDEWQPAGACLVVQPGLRLPLQKTLGPHLPRLAVLADTEIPEDLQVRIFQTLTIDDLNEVFDSPPIRNEELPGGGSGKRVHRPR